MKKLLRKVLVRGLVVGCFFESFVYWVGTRVV